MSHARNVVGIQIHIQIGAGLTGATFSKPGKNAVSRLVWISLLLFGALQAAAQGSVTTLESIRDNTLFQDSDGDTSNGAGPAVFAGRNSQNLTRRALLAFDIASAIPAGVKIDSVVLTLVVSSAPDTVSRMFAVHRVLRDWGEGSSYSAGGAGAPATPGDATWLHAFYPDQFWTSPGGDFTDTVSASETIGDVGTYFWTGAGMTSDVQAWLGHPETNFGWLVQGEETSPRTVRRFDSKESDLLANRPKLTIYYSAPVAVRSMTWGAIKARYR
jgi:hypothetical protein